MNTWTDRAGITHTEFLMMALVYGARRLAKLLGVYEKEDDAHVEIMGEWVLEF